MIDIEGKDELWVHATIPVLVQFRRRTGCFRFFGIVTKEVSDWLHHTEVQRFQGSLLKPDQFRSVLDGLGISHN